MSNRYFGSPQRRAYSPGFRAQGMVEFALTLPVFLLVVYGVIEFGRVLMTFSAVYSAAREAARYGAAVGTSGNSLAYYRDCDGMKEAAVRVGGLGGVQVGQVSIKIYDMNGGLKKIGSTIVGETWCTLGTPPTWNLEGGDRIDVTVNTQFWPVLPLVNLPSLPVSARSSRTLVNDVSPLDAPVKQTYEINIIINPPMGGTVQITPKKNRYEYGEWVNLTAKENDGFRFVNWSGDQTGTAPVFFPMYSNRTITANFEMIGYKLTVDTGGKGSVALVPEPDLHIAGDRYSFDYNTTPPTYQTVNLVATANTGFTFFNWSGVDTSSSNTATVLMNSSRDVAANFGIVYTLKVTTIGPGFVTSSLACIDTRIPLTSCSLPANTAVTLNATANSDYHFEEWTGSFTGTLDQAQFTMTSNKDIQAVFEQNGFSLATSTSGSGSISVSPPEVPAPDGPFPPGTPVTLTANPVPGWSFSLWSGDIPAGYEKANPVAFPMDANKAINAAFTQDQYTLSVSVSPEAGTVSWTPNQSTYTYGIPVTITAQALPGWTFDHWEWDTPSGSGTTNPLSLTMDANKTVTAFFVKNQYTLTIIVTEPAAVTVTKTPDKSTYLSGETVTVSAEAQPGWKFDHWSGDVPLGSNPADPLVTLIMDQSKTLTPVMVQEQYTIAVNVTPDGMGTVSQSPDQQTYVYGDKVTLSVTPVDGYHFSYWLNGSGPVPNSTNPMEIGVVGSETYTAVLELN